MKAFKVAVVVFALLPVLTGIGDVVMGVAVWQELGVGLSDAGFRDSVLDNQVRFMATIWLGYGVLLCICLRDLERYGTILQGALTFAFIGGIARVISISQVGMPESDMGSTFIMVALASEFIVIPLLLVWQRKLRKRSTNPI